jgi:hypothetical protein
MSVALSTPVAFTNKLTAFNKIINSGFASSERILDIPGYIPGVNLFSGATRTGVALVQAVYGLALLAFAGISHLYCLNRSIHNPLLNKVISDAGYLLRNAGYNLIRASFEVGVIGGIICLVYDGIKGQVKASDLASNYGSNVSNIELHRPFIAKLCE